MASGGTFGGSIKLTGESEYRSALRNITQSLREVSSELKLTAAQYSNNDKSLNTLKSKQEALNNTLSKQAKTVETARNAYEKFKAKVDEQAKAHDKLEKEYQEAQAKLEELKGTNNETSQEYQEQKAKVEELAKAVGKSNTANEQNENALSKLKTTLNNTETAYAQTENQLNDLNDEIKKAEEANKQMANSENDNRTATQKLNDKIKEQEEKLGLLKQAYKEASLRGATEEANELGKEIKILSGELAENKNKMNNLDKEADDLDESLKDVGDSAKNTSGGFTVMKGALANLASNAISSVIDKLKDMAVQTINTGKEFDEKMSNVVAISGATGKDFEALRQKAISMGASTKFSAGESADALGYMAMAGWKTNDMLDGLGGIMDLAAASGADLATTSDIVTDALTAFGKSAKDSGRLADIMAATSSNANTNVNLMGETFKYCASTAGSLGYSMEDTSIAIGLMANSGVKGSQAGTSLKNILVNLAKPTANMKKAMTELGISLTDSHGKMKPLSQVMTELREKFGKLSASQKAQYASTLAGKEGMAGLLAIVNASPKDFDKLTKAVNGSDGSAKKMAKTMADNLGGDLENLGGHLETVQIQLYDKFEPALRKAVSALDGLLDAVQFVVKHSSEFVTAIQAMAAGLGAYVAYTTALQIMKEGFMSLTVVTKAQTIAQAALNAVSNANWIAIIIAGIVALVAAFVLLWNKSDSFRKFWINIWNNISSFCKGAVDKISGFFTNTLPKAFDSMINALKKLPTNVSMLLGNVISNVVKWASDMGSKALSAGKDFVDNVIKKVTSLPKDVSSKLSDVISGVTTWAKDMGSEALDAGKKFVENVIKKVTSLPKDVSSKLSDVISGVTTWASDMGSKALSAGKEFVSNVIKNVTSLPGKVSSLLSKVISGLTTWASNMASKGAEGARRLATAVVNGVTSLPGKMLSIGGHIVTGLWNGIGDKVGWITSKIKGFGNSVMNAMKSIFGIHSPSKRMKDEVGVMLVKGVVEGVKEEQGKAIKDINSAQESSLKKLYKKRDEIQSKLEDSSTQKSKAKRQQYKEQLEKVNDQIAESQKKHNDKVGKQEEKFSDQLVKAAKTRVEQLEKQNKINEAQEISYWEAIQGYCKKGSDAYNKAATQLASAKAKLKSDVSDLTKSYVTETAKVNEELSKNIDELKKTYSEAISQRQSSITGTLNLFDSFKQDDSKSKEELSQNLQTQVNALAEWNNTLTSLENRLGGNTDLIKELDSMGVSSLDNLKELNNMSDAELANYVAMWKQKEAIAKDRAVKENATLKDETDKQVKELKAKAKKQINDLTKTYKNNLKKLGVGMKKPSKDIGKQIMSGIEAGLKAGSGSLSAELSKQCKKLVTQAKKELKIHSPSRVFRDEVGAMITQGISTGMVDEMPNAELEMKDSLSNLVNSMQDISTIPTNFDTSSNISTNGNVIDVETSYNNIVNAFKDALSKMKIELDDEEMGKFVDKTVSKAIYQ